MILKGQIQKLNSETKDCWYLLMIETLKLKSDSCIARIQEVSISSSVHLIRQKNDKLETKIM